MVVEIASPFSAFSSLGAVIDALLLFSGWAVVGIGFLCVPGSLVAAVLALVVAAMNLGVGLAQVVLCGGIAVACVGLCAPVYVGSRWAARALLAAMRRMLRS